MNETYTHDDVVSLIAANRALIAELQSLQDNLTTVVNEMRPIVEQVKPTIDALESSPMFRMIVGKQKRP